MRKHIPNIITCLNLFCGACGAIMALWGYLNIAFLFLIAAAIFDFLDGAAARALKAYSDIGKELDSLSDVISFGLVPALMLFQWYFTISPNPSYPAFIALLIAPFSALRLAKFNIDTRQTKSFLGLPTPACAMLVASLVSYGDICLKDGVDAHIITLLNTTWFIPVLAIILSLLLVSEIPMFSLKQKCNKLYAFAGAAIGLIPLTIVATPVELPLVANLSYYCMLLFITYILISLIPLQRPNS